MASILNQLSFPNLNPFSSIVGSKIEQATDANLPTENWALNMEICDLINESSDTAKDAAKAIRKRLNQNAGKNYTVIKYTLVVLETCVKNCGKPFHILVSNKDFINDLVKLIGPKNGPPGDVQDKVLSLIQIWADAFRNQPDLKGVGEVYEELRSKGIEFPPSDPDSLAPIYTPQRSVPHEEQQQQQQQLMHPRPGSSPSNQALHTGPPAIHPNLVAVGAVPPVLSPEQVAKLHSELEIVEINLTIFNEMLAELKPGQESPEDYRLLTELAATLKEMRGRIVELIGKVNNDEITAELLRLNDELNNAFLIYARYEKNRDPKAAKTPSAILGTALGQPSQKSLIDLSDGGASAGGDDQLNAQLAGLSVSASSQLSKLNTVSAHAGAAVKDEFDMLAQSRNTDGKPAVSVMPGKEDEFDEMEKWLGKSGNGIDAAAPPAGGGGGEVAEESLTSKEFERFLAERAAAAENLPTVPATAGTPSRNNKKKSKDGEEADLLA